MTVDLLGRYEEQQDTESVELSVIGQVPAPDHALIKNKINHMNLHTLSLTIRRLKYFS